MPQPQHARGLLIVVTLVWGLNFVSARFGLEAMTPLGFRLVTFGGGAIVLVLLAGVLRKPLALARGRDYLHLGLAGVFSIAGFGLLTAIALLHAPAGRTSIVVYTMPIWVALLSRVVLGERLGGRRAVAVVVGALGLGVLLVPSISTGIGIGVAAAFGSAVSWAIGTVYLKWAQVAASTLAVTIWQLVAGAVVLGIAVLCTADPVVAGEFTPLALGGVLYTMLVGTVLAYVLWFRVVQRLPASTSGLGTLLVPVFGTVFGVLLLGEQPTIWDVAGFALIFLAGVLALSRGTRASS